MMPASHAPAASLEALIGASRAALLRALDQPATVGELARLLHIVPSGITHHLHVLEPAGLVMRQRAGRTVTVHRTTRGDLLLALYVSEPCCAFA
jgi:DNA-binding transcriptional ArsR family regulator